MYEPILDWIAFSLPYTIKTWKFILKNIGHFRERERGINGYSHSAIFECDGIIAWSPARRENRIHITLSSAAIHNLKIVPQIFINDVIENNGSFTRIDIAIDDKIGLLNLDKIYDYVKRKSLVSKFWSVENREFTPLREGGKFGRGIYFGSRLSDSFFRMYDKQIQTGSNHHWIRVELEAKKDVADLLSRQIDILNCNEIFMNYIDFKNPYEKNRISRKKTVSWWKKFLDNVDGKKLTYNPDKRGLEHVHNWIVKQAGQSIGAIYEVMGKEEIFKIIDESRHKLSKNKKLQIKMLRFKHDRDNNKK